MRYLQAAAKLAPNQALKVSIAPDSYIRASKRREPYWSQADRAATVFALGCVSDVLLQPEDSLAWTIRRSMPSFVVKGPDWKHSLPDDVRQACQDVGADLIFTDTPGRNGREARR